MNRRGFLVDTAVAAAGTLFAGRSLGAEPPANMGVGTAIHVPADLAVAPERFLSATSAADLHTLAAQAIDAARAAGAVYADIRLAEFHQFWPNGDNCTLTTQFTFGVRALVHGAWGFAFGRDSGTDAVVRCAQDAVVSARIADRLASGDRKNGARQVVADSWTPAPVRTGEWHTPLAVDPFTVPIRQQLELLDALKWAAGRTVTSSGYVITEWTKELRVFAATTGAALTQQFHRARIGTPIIINYGSNRVWVRVPELQSASGGYELLAAPDLPDRIKAACEAMLWLSRLPVRSIDIGKYPVILDGHAMGDVLSHVIGPSAALDRVLGHQLDLSESSPWSTELLGTPIASPLLTITANRALPSLSAVQWDDEGNVPAEHTVITDGILTDYHTSGTTVGVLNDWYARQGRPLQSNGCTVAPMANKAVTIRSPDLTLAQNRSTMSLDDLCRDMKHGIVALDDRLTRVHTDQQLQSGAFDADRMLFEVAGGKIVRRLKQMALQFSTAPFLKGVMAVGDVSTVRQINTRVSEGFPWEMALHRATAPAVLFKEINVVRA